MSVLRVFTTIRSVIFSWSPVVEKFSPELTIRSPNFCLVHPVHLCEQGKNEFANDDCDHHLSGECKIFRGFQCVGINNIWNLVYTAYEWTEFLAVLVKTGIFVLRFVVTFSFLLKIKISMWFWLLIILQEYVILRKTKGL